MVEKIEAFKASDGSLHADKDTALRREIHAELAILLNRQETWHAIGGVAVCGGGGGSSSSNIPMTTVNHAIREDTIMENAEKVIEILQRYLAAK